MSFTIEEILRQKTELIKLCREPFTVELNKTELQDIENYFRYLDLLRYKTNKDTWRLLIGGNIYGLKILYCPKSPIVNVLD